MARARGSHSPHGDGADEGVDGAFEDEFEDAEFEELDDDDLYDEDELDDEDDGDPEDDDYAPRKVTRTLCFGLVAMAPLSPASARLTS